MVYGYVNILMEGGYMKYLNKLDYQKILDVLNENGLFLLDSIDEQLEGFDENSESYYLRCYSVDKNRNSTAEKLKDYICSQLPNLRFNLGKYISSPVDLFELNDFFIQRFDLDEITQFDINLQASYHNMMLHEFSDNEEYISDYNNYVSNLEQEM